MTPTVSTQRLDLVVLDADALDALLAGDAAGAETRIGARFPTPLRPPPHMEDALPPVRDRLRTRPDEAPWWNWLVIEKQSRQAAGSVSFGGPPDASGGVLIGYSLYPEHESKGYATEAVVALVQWAFAQPGVKTVRAMAPVWNTPAIRVAERIGMHPVGSNQDDEVGEVLVYAIDRK